jgi:hypothetical protein
MAKERSGAVTKVLEKQAAQVESSPFPDARLRLVQPSVSGVFHPWAVTQLAYLLGFSPVPGLF